MVGREIQEAGGLKKWMEGEKISDRCKGGETGGGKGGAQGVEEEIGDGGGIEKG